MDQYNIRLEEGNCETITTEMPRLSNQLMCLAALAVLTFIGLVQYSVIVIVD